MLSLEGSPSLGLHRVRLALQIDGAAYHQGPPDLSDVVDCFSYPVEFRPYVAAAGVDSNGYPITTNGPGKEIALAHINYATARTVARLPEGHTVGSSIEIHTTRRCKVDDTINRIRGDEVVWDGRLFRIDVAGSCREGPTGAFLWGIYFAREIDVKPGDEVD